MAFLHGPLPPLHAPRAPACPQGPLVLDQLVHVVLGAVLAGGDLENEGNAEQGFLGIPVRNNLQQSRVCQGSAVPVGRCCYLGGVAWAQAQSLCTMRISATRYLWGHTGSSTANLTALSLTANLIAI